VLAATSVLGAVVSLLRPRDEGAAAPRRRRRALAIDEAISEEIEATP